MTSGVWCSQPDGASSAVVWSRWVRAAVLVMDDSGRVTKWQIQDPEGHMTAKMPDDVVCWPVGQPPPTHLTVELSGLVVPTGLATGVTA